MDSRGVTRFPTKGVIVVGKQEISESTTTLEMVVDDPDQPFQLLDTRDCHALVTQKANKHHCFNINASSARAQGC